MSSLIAVVPCVVKSIHSQSVQSFCVPRFGLTPNGRTWTWRQIGCGRPGLDAFLVGCKVPELDRGEPGKHAQGTGKFFVDTNIFIYTLSPVYPDKMQ